MRHDKTWKQEIVKTKHKSISRLSQDQDMKKPCLKTVLRQDTCLETPSLIQAGAKITRLLATVSQK